MVLREVSLAYLYILLQTLVKSQHIFLLNYIVFKTTTHFSPPITNGVFLVICFMNIILSRRIYGTSCFVVWTTKRKYNVFAYSSRWSLWDLSENCCYTHLSLCWHHGTHTVYIDDYSNRFSLFMACIQLTIVNVVFVVTMYSSVLPVGNHIMSPTCVHLTFD